MQFSSSIAVESDFLTLKVSLVKFLLASNCMPKYFEAELKLSCRQEIGLVFHPCSRVYCMSVVAYGYSGGAAHFFLCVCVFFLKAALVLII